MHTSVVSNTLHCVSSTSIRLRIMLLVQYHAYPEVQNCRTGDPTLRSNNECFTVVSLNILPSRCKRSSMEVETCFQTDRYCTTRQESAGIIPGREMEAAKSSVGCNA